MQIVGVVLAAGAGRRMGAPKALVRDAAGTAWVVRTSRLLAASGCDPVVVVVGAAAAEVTAELTDEPVRVVVATNWEQGMGASLRAALDALAPADAALVVPVDLPGLTEAAVRRIAAEADRDALVRAVYDGTPGHPVLLGTDHWSGVREAAVGDQGARSYLRDHPPRDIDCSALADGADVDRSEQLPPGHRLS
ncbi:NTP transferase domain-containing protein [Kribbella sp. NPDC056345]|uniref:nucleotidyltransferase family protein n=1 Tax=Kribbella sp. NPDC056345 TaxID=3345789 RepID=UPI0035DB5E43